MASPKDEIETRWRELGEFIREQRRVGHLSLRKLSELAGISNPYLSQIERGLRKPSAEILQQIARALADLAPRRSTCGPASSRSAPATADLVGEILRDPFLTEDQKQTLVRIYDSFRHENGNADGDVADARRGIDRGARRPDSVPPTMRTPGRCSRCTRRRWPSPARATAAA